MAPLVAGIAVLNTVGLFVAAFAERVSPRSRARPLRRRVTQTRERASEFLRFLRAWLHAPLRIASVAPSGRALARLMTADISAATGPVIELGPGTGPFTRALLDKGVREADLALVEFEESFARELSRTFPEAHTIGIDAAALGTIELFGGRPAGAVVSGLPLLAMPERQVEAILRAAFGKLEPDGVFHQFTYGPTCPVPTRVLDRLGLRAERVGRTLANLPPATVYRLRRTAGSFATDRSPL